MCDSVLPIVTKGRNNMKERINRFTTVLLSVIMICLLAAPAMAKTWFVDDDGRTTAQQFQRMAITSQLLSCMCLRTTLESEAREVR
jgi:hypothetical protein